MKKIIISIAFLLFGNIAYAQTVNNVAVKMQGANQNVFITQFGANHTANFALNGDSISIIASQSGQTPQSFSLSVTCGFTCPNSPYIINQY